MRAVIDTNVIVSSVLGGQLAEVITRWRAGEFTLIVSDAIASEYLEVLRRPKFGLPPEVIDSIGAYLFQRAEFVTPTETIRAVPEDARDDKFIEAALAGNADVIVTGDRHLLSIRHYRNIAILTARAFLDDLTSTLSQHSE